MINILSHLNDIINDIFDIAISAVDVLFIFAGCAY